MNNQPYLRNPRISLYIPAFNAKKYLPFCLDSIFSQSLRPEEIILIDDGSTDGTGSVAEGFPIVRVVSQPRNLGLACARNRGIAEAKFDFVASIDADCVAQPDWLEKLLEGFFVDNAIVGVGGQLLERYQTNLADRWRATHLAQNRGSQSMIDPPFLWGHSTLFLKPALEMVGCYHPPLKTNAEDVELSERIVRAKMKIYYQPQAVAYHLKVDSFLSVAKTNWRYYFFGYFYDIRLVPFFINFRLNGLPRWRQLLISDFSRRELPFFSLTVFILGLSFIWDLAYLVQNYGKKRLYSVDK